MTKRIVIVGGVAGGATSAARLRRLSENDEIVLFERGEHISFANCGLPYYIGDVIKDKEKLLVTTADHFRERFNVDVRTKSEVIKLDRERKRVMVKDHSTGKEYEQEYDHLILSPGAQPIKPPLPGVDDERVFTLRTVPDAVRIKEYIEKKNAESAVVIGGGFIGLEMAENLHRRGIRVTVVEKLPQVMPNLDPEIANVITQHMKLKKVNFILGTGISGFSDSSGKLSADLENGDRLSCDMAILSIGVRPDTKFIADTGIEVEKNGAIRVDNQMRTNDPNIFAIGDAVMTDNPILGTRWGIALAWPANREARVVADVINGMDEKYPGTIGTSIVKIFDLTVAATGCSEKYLKQSNVSYKKIYTHSPQHVTYYPGATPISIKLLFDPSDGRIFGAQMIGLAGVDKRIDVLATAIRCGAKVTDLKNLELAYAPPYGAARDPINILGYVAENAITKKVDICQWDDVDRMRSEGDKYFLDVRTPEEYSLGTVADASNIPVDELRQRLDEVPKDKSIVSFCQVGLRGYIASRILTQNGYKSMNMTGGYKTFQQATDRISSHFMHEDDEMESEEMMASTEIQNVGKAILLDACGMLCPGPIRKTYESIVAMSEGEVLEVKASDPGFANDIKAWCKATGNVLLSLDVKDGIISAQIMKKKGPEQITAAAAGDEKTIVVFSGDFDRVMAAFVIATGAASMGRKVNMFFTFWGLNALRKSNGRGRGKDFLSKMFGAMMPRGVKKMKISKLNMGGVGTLLMKHIMKKKHVDSLPDLLSQAQKMGVKLIACQMTMDVMGIQKEELIDDVDLGGVANFLADTDRSNASLFI